MRSIKIFASQTTGRAVRCIFLISSEDEPRKDAAPIAARLKGCFYLQRNTQSLKICAFAAFPENNKFLPNFAKPSGNSYLPQKHYLFPMQKSIFLLFFIFFGTLTIPASFQYSPQTDQLILKVKVIGVKDGDTVEVLYYQLPMVIRLEHIDAPEKKQAFGTVSKQKLSELCFGKNVTLISKGKKGNYDGRGRMIAEIYVNDKICANKEMVKSGLAWHYKKYSKSGEYAQLENMARKNRVGLWADKSVTAPWDFRK
ncbi:thermonuclease family protein [Chryseobacterium sp. MDT2-18]|uniref:thermonuclease family protein n=1 Tax=Chryseobacterium sp. MDT2-18 TaxID=1259136 RepID=UPI002784702D|nr:thermonuclease family protein [Chryseobacterium sp. MDT2-18]MDQ0478072.1 endonuclease YncB(thermonuclease family) [Chryseobacterium sp. MDT2-18]